MRDASIGPRAWDTMNSWTHSSYELATVVKYLKKLERPIPGSGKHLEGSLTAWVAFEEGPAPPPPSMICAVCGGSNDEHPEEENTPHLSFYFSARPQKRFRIQQAVSFSAGVTQRNYFL